MKRTKKDGRGGRREGAGRPKKTENTNGESKLYTFRAPGDIARIIEGQENKSEFIKDCIVKSLAAPEHDLGQLGDVYPATKVRDAELPFFDIRIVAGFPVPLDNDELAQSIELLKMLCPNPESSYLVRVQGESMIDAGVCSGDIVIVDKSNRNPDSRQIAVCELNGEYTLKRFERRGAAAYLVPANPDYPEIEIHDNDDFSIWGVVTYIIHKPRE